MSSSVLLRLAASASDGAMTTGEVDEGAKRSGELEPRSPHGLPRRSIKRNALARGLARKYDAQKAREDAYKARVSRQLEQKERARSLMKSDGYDRRSRSPVRGDESLSDCNSDADREGADGERDANENGVILRLRSRSKTSSSKFSSRQGKPQDRRAYHQGGDNAGNISGSRTLVVPARHAVTFTQKPGLRRELTFPTNQLEVDSLAEDGGSVTAGDVSCESALQLNLATRVRLALSSPVVLRASHRGPSNVLAADMSAAASPIHQQQPAATTGAAGGGSMSHWRPDRSSALVLCELLIAKEIIAREQALRQLSEAVGAFDSIAKELIEAVDAKKAAKAAVGAGVARAFRLRCGSSSSMTLLRPDSGSQAQSNAAAMATLQQNVVALTSTVDKLTEKMRQRVKQIESLVESLREATASIVEGVKEWRSLQHRPRSCSSFYPLLRFSWKNGKVPNYVLHLQSDVRALFRSTALTYLLGANAEFNALLLPRSLLSTMCGHHEGEGAVVSPSKTFLTDKVTATSTVTTGSVENQASSTVPEFDQHLYNALMTVLPRRPATFNEASRSKVCSTPQDLQLWRSCLEFIAREEELEKSDSERYEQDAERIQRSYNPFHAIKAVGGIDEQFSTLLAEQSPHVEKLRQQLRRRQQDATDYVASADAGGCGSAIPIAEGYDEARATIRSDRRLHISTLRLHHELQRRREMNEAAMRCETRDAVTACASADSCGAMRNRLQGKVLVRKQPITTMRREDRLARIIQRQFRAYRARGNVLQSLAGLVGAVRASTVNIQRVYRGHMVKLRFQDVLARRNALRRQRIVATRTILLAYRRYKRRQRHRQSITVVAIAQAQLQSILVSKSQDADDVTAMKNEETERLRRLGAERRHHRAVMLEQQRREQLALEAKQAAAAIKIQSIMRSQLAQRAANVLRQEKKAHIAAVSAITIQSRIRTFLVRQEARRRRFRRDLERVNRSAERIQRVYRDYSLRSHETPIEAVEEGDEDHEDEREMEGSSDEEHWDGKLPAFLLHSTTRTGPKSGPPTVERIALPPLTRPTASSLSSRRPSRQLTTPPTPATVSMMRVELKLKEPVIDFHGPSGGSNSARRGFFQGWHGRG